MSSSHQVVLSSRKLQRIESESIDGIAQTETEIEGVEATLAEVKKIHDHIYAVNSAEMTIRQNDLDVFTFILVFTKCADETSFVQFHQGAASESRICETHGGQKAMHFHDKSVQQKYSRLLTPNSRRMVSDILEAIQIRPNIQACCKLSRDQ